MPIWSYGKEANLPQVSTNDIMYVTIDQDNIYLDLSGVRHKISDIVYVDTFDELPLTPKNKLYFTIDTSKMYRYSNGEWKGISGNIELKDGKLTDSDGNLISANHLTNVVSTEQIGIDIATLENGKVPSEQLPALNYLPLAGGTITGAINMSNKNIKSLGAPIDNNDATTKAYVDTKEATLKTYADNVGLSGKRYTDSSMATLTSEINAVVGSINSNMALKAPIANPTFSGSVKVPTPVAVSGQEAINVDYLNSKLSSFSTKPFHLGTTAPANTNLIWIDSSKYNCLKFYNGTAWIVISAVWYEP